MGRRLGDHASRRPRREPLRRQWLLARRALGDPPEGQKQSAQVLRLDKADGKWQVDLDLGKANDLGLEYMKGNILKSVSFSTTGEGRVLNASKHLLIMAAGANFERGGAVSVWVRDDVAGTWHHTLVRHGSNAGGIRWVPRDLQVYRDRVTGVDRIFYYSAIPALSVACTIRANLHESVGIGMEFPFLTKGSFFTRPLGIAEANDALHFSEGPPSFAALMVNARGGRRFSIWPKIRTPMSVASAD